MNRLLDSLWDVSSFLPSFGLVGFEGRCFEVGFEGPAPVEVLVGPDAVVFVEVAGDVVGELDAVGDAVAVEPLVFQRLEPARSMTPLVCGKRCRMRT